MPTTGYVFLNDMDPPFIETASPPPGTSGILPTTDVYLKISDVSAGVDVSSLRIYVDDHLAVSGDFFLPPFDGPVSIVTPDGLNFSILIDPTTLFGFGEEILVRAQAADCSALANILDNTYSFFTSTDTSLDIKPPTLAFRSPENGTSSNTTDTEIVIVLDDDNQVDLFNVVIRVAGDVAYATGAAGAGYRVQVLPEGNGFQFRITPTDGFDPGALVTVSVDAKDLGNNQLKDSWNFSVVATLGGDVPSVPGKKSKASPGRMGGAGGANQRPKKTNSQRRDIED